MPSTQLNTDFLIIGGGIVGLSIARALSFKYPDQSIVVLDKEPVLGLHASGRNSGVLHSGIYYPSDSLKLKFCIDGANRLRAYAEEFKLKFNETGKVILPITAFDAPTLEKLYQQALASNITVERLNESELKALEPDVNSATGKALFLPNTASFNPNAIVNQLQKELTERGVQFLLGEGVTHINDKEKTLQTKTGRMGYGTLINAAGAFADKLAHACHVGKQYRLLPFKGTYYKLSPHSNVSINHHIYPVPDLHIPFLGVHFTVTTGGYVTVGPSAIPAFGPENYRGLNGAVLSEVPEILTSLARQYIKNQKGFRNYTHQEIIRMFKPSFVKAAQGLIPQIKSSDLLSSDKVGIRAQLYDTQANALVMDFLIERGEHSIHILNAVSPAFTCGLSFGDWLVEEYLSN